MYDITCLFVYELCVFIKKSILSGFKLIKYRKKGGWILAKFVFFFFACLSTEAESINTQKKNKANIQPS